MEALYTAYPYVPFSNKRISKERKDYVTETSKHVSLLAVCREPTHESTLQIRASNLRKHFPPPNITPLASQIKTCPKAMLLLKQLQSLRKVTADLLHSQVEKRQIGPKTVIP